MSLTDQTLVFEPNLNVHVMVVYEDRSKLDELVYAFLNEGLKQKQFCVYASVNLDHSVYEKISSNIIEFKYNIMSSNFIMVDLQPYLLSTMDHDLTPFRNLKQSISNKVRKRSNEHIRLYGDLVSHLYENKNYEECFLLERWWQKNPIKGTKICPYQTSVLDNSPVEKKRELFDSHDEIIVC